MKLTERQQRFVDAYDGNGTAAARAAGYTGDDRTLAAAASRLLTNGNVKAALEARRVKVLTARSDAQAVTNIASRIERQSFWTKTMLDPEVEMKDRLKASELLGKSEADFTEKVKHSGVLGTLPAELTAEQVLSLATAGGDDEQE